MNGPALLRRYAHANPVPGLGIAPADVPRVLEPGFGKGLGIALKNVDDRLKGHFGLGSGLEVASVAGEGTTVTMSIVVPATAKAGD